MKRFLLLATSMTSLVLIAGAASAQPGMYFSGLAGGSFMPAQNLYDSTGSTHETFNTGLAYGGALGWDTGNGWRMEFDTLHQLSRINRFAGVPATGHLWSTSVMANVSRDLIPNFIVTPYVGVGAGYADIGATVGGVHGDQWKPAYQAELGLRENLTQGAQIFAEYRYTQSESARIPGTLGPAHQHFSDHAILAGIAFGM